MPQPPGQFLFLSRAPAAPQPGTSIPGQRGWSGLVCGEAKAELALGGSNNMESFWVLQATGLGVIKEERRHGKAHVSKGKV